LGRRFGGLSALEEFNLGVPEGGLYGLIGPNGAGKTTAFRMLAGLMAPAAGRARICGVDVQEDPLEAKRHLGFLTGTTGLYGRLSAREQLTYFAALHHMPRARLEKRLGQLAVALDLGHLLDRRCDKLSTGERQRVSVARAVIHQPEVLILDEPTAGLDVLASRFLRDFMRSERDSGRAILFSTHYLTEAELLCNRIGLLHRGRLLCQGPPGELHRESGVSSLEEVFLRRVQEEAES
jgi:sodium transport system ATP-binding protein